MSVAENKRNARWLARQWRDALERAERISIPAGHDRTSFVLGWLAGALDSDDAARLLNRTYATLPEREPPPFGPSSEP